MVYIITRKHNPKIPMRELVKTKASTLMRNYGMSEHALQQEINRHAQDGTPTQKADLYKEIYTHAEKE